jgi:hypothetical protein
MDAQLENTSPFFRSEDAFLIMIWGIAASFIFASPGFAAQCPELAEPVYTAKAASVEIDRVRVEYTGRAGRQAGEPADLRLALFRGKECVAQCRSTQPLKAEALDIVDFRCSSTTLTALETLATLRLSENRLLLGNFLSGYRSFNLEQPESRFRELARTLRAETRIATAEKISIRENQ